MSKNIEHSYVADMIDRYRASLPGAFLYHDGVAEISLVASMIQIAAYNQTFAAGMAQRAPDLAERMKNHPTGRLALECFNKVLPLEILDSSDGYYIGTKNLRDLCTRESEECWRHPRSAYEAIIGGNWTQKQEP